MERQGRSKPSNRIKSPTTSEIINQKAKKVNIKQITTDDLNQYMPTYNFMDVLGQGEFGKTFLAVNENDEKVVVKILSKYNDFLREILCLKRVVELNLSGKEFVRYIRDDTFEIEGQKVYVIITEYNEGYITAYDFMNKIQDQIKIKINEIRKKLSDNGLRHNDLHWGNILIDNLKIPDLDIKVIDFGQCDYDDTSSI
jgi:serine/threonine protein kinase